MNVFFWAIDPRVAFWTRFEANFRLGRNQGPLFLNGLASPRVPGQLQKIIFDLQLADLPVEFADLDFLGLVVPIAAALEHAGCAVEQRLLPGVDLAGMDAILAGQFANRAVALECRQGNLRLESCAVFLSRLLH